MKSHFADEYWKAPVKEIETLEKMGVWDVADCPEGANVVDSTWVFNLKCYPDGLNKKFKACFVFVVTSKSMVLISLRPRSGSSVENNTVDAHSRGYTWFEIQAGRYYCCLCPPDVEEGKNIYVEMHCGFRKQGKVLKLIKALYGLQQSPRAFWLYLTEKMNLCGMEQLTFDPCIFLDTKIMCICYIGHLIFWALDKSDINGLANQLITSGVSLQQESDAARFLGVRMETNPITGLMELKQTGLIDRVIETRGLDISTTSGKFTPAVVKPLVKDANGEPALVDFTYNEVVGMLL
jgi:hypothetical protein